MCIVKNKVSHLKIKLINYQNIQHKDIEIMTEMLRDTEDKAIEVKTLSEKSTRRRNEIMQKKEIKKIFLNGRKKVGVLFERVRGTKHILLKKKKKKGFPGGAVVENLPANAGDTGLSPGLGRSHMPRSNQARVPQLLSLHIWSLCPATREAETVKGPRTTMKRGPGLPQLEKALAQKRRPNAAKNK